MADSSACEAKNNCGSKDAKSARKCRYKCRKEAYNKCIKGKKCRKCSTIQEIRGKLGNKKADDANYDCWQKRKECLGQCGPEPKKDKRYAPEPSSQYELDSFEIGTESSGEIHELNDEYEFGPHDEYEEVDHCNPNDEDYDPDYRCYNLGTMKPRVPKAVNPPPSKRKTLRKMQHSKGKSKGKYRYTSEPIPDYIMRALQPKKSLHPEYGKLRY